MAVLSFRIGIYARQIYLSGSQRFTERDGYTGIPAEYYGPCTAYAAKNFTLYETAAALANTWINQQEYDDTVALRTDASPLRTQQDS